MANRLRENLRLVRARIDAACARAGRVEHLVGLVAVTKSVGPEVCAELLELGQVDLGESRADELESKARWCAARGLRPRWHFLGHLQRNKARRVVALDAQIHSVDSLRLLESLQRIAAETDRRVGVWLEVDFTSGPTRTGLAAAEVPCVLERCRGLDRLDLLGLMTMAPPPGRSGLPPSAAIEPFQALAELRASLQRAAFHDGRGLLSMGMSLDFEQAIAAGSDLVRIGSALFEGLALPAAPDLGGGRA